jgi:hypothetical protein
MLSFGSLDVFRVLGVDNRMRSEPEPAGQAVAGFFSIIQGARTGSKIRWGRTPKTRTPKTHTMLK